MTLDGLNLFLVVLFCDFSTRSTRLSPVDLLGIYTDVYTYIYILENALQK